MHLLNDSDAKCNVWLKPLAETLKRVHNHEPVHLFLSGASAPYSETRLNATKRSDLSDEDFMYWMMTVGGTPPELLADPKMVKHFLVPLKADMHLLDSYRCDRPASPLLSCPITCFDGRQDSPHDLQAWKEISSGDFTVKMFDGGHFYLKLPENEKVILDYITQNLETLEMDYL